MDSAAYSRIGSYAPAKSTFELKLQVALPCNTNFVKVDVTIRRLKVVLTECIKRSQAILLIQRYA